MTATIARLILAMLILPAPGAGFLLTFLAVRARSSGSGPPSGWAVAIVWLVVYTFVATYWILLWRSTVRWTRSRVWKTALAGLLALAGGAALAVAAIVISRSQIP